MMELTGGWQKLERRINRWASDPRARDWRRHAPYAVVALDGQSAVRKAAELGLIDGARLIAGADAVIERDFTVFETPLPKSTPWPWHRDWRLDHEWAPDYYRNYDHTALRDRPYDVKFPWELSRLSFLPTLIQADILDGGIQRTSAALNILADWSNSNPLAHSVNWYPMEGAMRGIELCLLADMARQVGLTDRDASLILRELAAHGEFVMRTLELTDHAGNHFAAQLVALLLIARTLDKSYPQAHHWRRFAGYRLSREVLQQFLPDGVNFEKATAYHRLALELFLLGSIALDRSALPLAKTERARLRAAARYNAAFLRPDGQCPLIGDSDDAVIFAFEQLPVRDHRAGIGVAAMYFDDGDLKSAARTIPVTGLWLFGSDALKRWRSMPEMSPHRSVHRHFRDGGVFIAKSKENFLFMDIGEVGQNGLGGHGHNDLLSFELFLGGRSLLIDPGSYLYSGDYAAHDRFRATRAHNSLVVDDREIAPLRGNFRIANSARPINVTTTVAENNPVIVTAGHTGYRDLPDPVLHQRTIIFQIDTGAFHCRDRIDAKGNHHTVRYLHFAPGIALVMSAHQAQIEWRGDMIVVRWDRNSSARLVDDKVSPGYGRLAPSKTLEMVQDTVKETVLTIDIYFASSGPISVQGLLQ